MIILTLILGLIALDISLRLYLMSLTVLDARRKFTSKQKKNEEESQKEAKKALKKQKRSKFAKKAHKTLVLAGQFAVRNTIRVIKSILRLIRVVITALTSLLGGWVVAVVVIIVALVAVISSIVSDPELLGTPMSGLKASSSEESSSGSGTFNCTADLSGLNKEKWDSADPIGQEVACNALTIIQKPPGNGLFYSQSSLALGAYDCGRFTGASLGMIGVTQSQTKLEPPFDYKTMNQNQSNPGVPVASVAARFKGTEAEIVSSNKGGSLDFSKMKAGDLYFDSQHGLLYLGEGTDGKHYIAHASMPGAQLSTTVEKFINGNKDSPDVGVGLLWDQYGKPNRGYWTVIRPSIITKMVDEDLYNKKMNAGSDSDGGGSGSSPKLYTLREFQQKGVVNWEGTKFTYYSEKVLPGPGLNIPGRKVSSDGYVVDKDGNIVLAAPRGIKHGKIYQTPFGHQGKVYDTCGSCTTSPLWLDVYTK